MKNKARTDLAELSSTFIWKCSSCNHLTSDTVTDLGPVLEVICNSCEKTFSAAELTEVEAVAWDSAIEEMEWKRDNPC